MHATVVPVQSAAASERSWSPVNLLQFAVVVVELILVGGALSMFSWNIANPALQDVILLAFGGVILNHFLPLTLRLPFFAGLSVCSVLLVFGLSLGAWLLAVGLLLILACHLPIALYLRIVLLIAICSGLMAMRAYWPDWNGVTALWPILGSMFMFRLIIYMYDLSTNNAPFSPTRSLAYFFMLPNVCFPLYPVVDYKTFCATHNSEDKFHSYQTGLKWILRGTVQLILYRVVYQFLLNDPAEIQSGGELIRYMISTYLLYLHISGDFHLIVGILHLYGFNLPETHHRWLLASSFLDFWRRINIYWKDFIMKVVFYPLYFRLRRIGHIRAMLLSGGLAFVGTWILHSYQWFWIRGTFLISSQDIAFWTILGVLVVTNMWWDMRRKSKRRLTPAAAESRLTGAARTGLKTMATFATIAILWSMWSSPSLEAWFVVLGSAQKWGTEDVLLIAGILLSIGVAGALWGHSSREWSTPAQSGSSPQVFQFWRSAAAVTTAAMVVFLLGRPELHWQLGPEGVKQLAALRSDSLNKADTKVLEQGYYEELTNTVRFSPALWEVFNKEPAGWLGTAPGDKSTDDGWVKKLQTSIQVTFKGAVVTTNSWGMRDQEYTLDKPPNSYRMALFGDSHTLGSGVNDEEVYSWLVEERLNREQPEGRKLKYEILNFGVPGSGPIHKLATLEERALQFRPDAVLYAGTDLYEFKWAVRDLAMISHGEPVPYPELVAITQEAGVYKRLLPEVVLQNRLRPYAKKLLNAVYGRVVAHCHELEAECFFVINANTSQLTAKQQQIVAETAAVARQAGFTVLDLTQAYAGVERLESLWVVPWDNHPNADGHRLLAEQLYQQLVPRLRQSAPTNAEESLVP